MLLNELFYNLSQPKLLSEGGNLSVGDKQADTIDLKVHNRAYIVPVLNKLLHNINNAFVKSFKQPVWNANLLSNRKFLSGSSLHFFNTDISDDEFTRLKPKVGDIDTQVNVKLRDNVKSFLDQYKGKRIGDATFLGYEVGNEQFSALWELQDPPVKVQIDFEFVEYGDKDEPTDWAQFSHSSSWEDIQAGVKGVFHKFIIQAFTGLTRKEFLLRKLVGRGKARAEQDVPTTDNMLSFAVSSKEGGGLRQKYDPVLDQKGKPLVIDRLPVLRARAAEGYDQNIASIFSTIFDKKITPQQMKTMEKKFWSFTGLLEVMNTLLDPDEKSRVVESFIRKLFERGAQGLYKNDPDRDIAEKSVALDLMIKTLKVKSPEHLEQMKQDYKDNYRMTGTTESLEEDDAAPNYKRQSMKHIYNPGSSTEISDRDFVKLVDSIKNNLKGKLDTVKIDLKVDGAGIRFGKDSKGEPFFMTSKVTEPLHADKIGTFASYANRNGDADEVQLARAKHYDDALSTIVKSDFIKVLPKDTIVQAEMLYNPMAEQSSTGLKFVNIEYDPNLLGKEMTLVPFLVKQYSTGEKLENGEKIITALIKKSNDRIKIISTQLAAKGLDVTGIIDPVASMNPELLATIAPRTKDTPEKRQAQAIIAKAKKELSDYIADHPGIVGKDQIGKDNEGLVINIPGVPPVKVTSQLMKQKMAAKNAKPAGANNQPTKTAVVAIGSFVGHRGHEVLFNHALSEAKRLGGDPYLFISQSVSKDDPIPGDMKLATWQRLYPNHKNSFSLVQNQPDGTKGSLFKKIEHELVKPKPGQLPDYNNIIVTVGEDRANMSKQAEHLQTRLNRFPGYEHVKVSLQTIARDADKGGNGISFTQCRDALKDPNLSEEQKLAVWSQAFDVKKLGTDWIKQLMATAKTNMGIHDGPK